MDNPSPLSGLPSHPLNCTCCRVKYFNSDKVPFIKFSFAAHVSGTKISLPSPRLQKFSFVFMSNISLHYL